MNHRTLLLAVFACVLTGESAISQDANRLTYLDEFLSPYHVSQSFPKLTTPQWVTKPGVEAVVVLAIDDMRDTAKYENYLRPIIDRLKQIDGRAPVSIMTNRADPQDPQLQRWLKEGLSIEVHTYDHPCPCLQKGDFAASKQTYERCVDLMAQIEGNHPVAFRMPCCDSLNTPSPRFFAEIFDRTTKEGNFLSIDSSVFQVFTAQDPDLPEQLVTDEEGQPRFRKYIPFPSFVNTIENYPYPYLIGRKCWQFPCMVPSDWEAQNLQRPNNPRTVRDMKAALDATVLKQGVFNLVFHPHGWIRNDQVVELIDHAQKKHGDKVLFLTFREALAAINQQLLGGSSLRSATGADNGVRTIDLNADGYLDVVIGNDQMQKTRVWNPKQQVWREYAFPAKLVASRDGKPDADAGVRFATLDGHAIAIRSADDQRQGWRFTDDGWRSDPKLVAGLETPFAVAGSDRGARFRDVDGDQTVELIVANAEQQTIYRWSGQGWRQSSIIWPEGATIVDRNGRDAGLRFVDVNEDGFDDVLFSNQDRYSLHLWNTAGEKKQPGWTVTAAAGDRGDNKAIPMIVRDGTNNGAWFHSQTLWIQNEDTHRLPNLVDRRKFVDMLPEKIRDFPAAKTPQQALRSLRVTDGLQVELAAAEPLVHDPIAIDFGFDGSLFVVEMGDYPNGVDGAGGSGGRVKQLWDDNGDGQFDRATVFLDKLPFPTGVKAWRDGVLITAAPDILFARDLDGDGKADKVEKRYTGFREGNQQHRVNGLRWGLDNWLYLANGDSGGEIRAADGKETINIRGRDLRISPDDGRLDPLAGQTQFGRNRDDWGNWFGGNNSNPMWQYVLEDQVTRRNPHVRYGALRPNVYETPGAAPVFPRSRTLARFNDFNKSNRFTSACSPIIYRDRALGAAFAGDAFVCEPVHNLVHREKTRYEGVRMLSQRDAAEQQSEFLASSDNWFRPTMVRTGPDGALWIVDMYRFVIEHPEWIPRDWQERLTLRAGNDMGRIYRVTPLRKSLSTPRPISQLSPTELVKTLESQNGVRRDMAHQRLVWDRELRTIAPLRRLAVESANPLGRIHALSVLAAGNYLHSATLKRAIVDEHPGVRRWALHWAIRHDERHALLKTILTRVADEDARVRMECAIALGHFGDSQDAAAGLAKLAARCENAPYLRAAVLSSLHRENLSQVTARLAGDVPPEESAPEVLSAMLTMASAIDVDDVWQFALEPRATPIPLWQLRTAQQIAARLRTRSPDSIPKDAAKRLSALLAAAREIAKNDSDPARRIAAIRLLGDAPLDRDQSRDVLVATLQPQSPVALQQAAVQALAGDGSTAAAEALFAAWPAATPSVRNNIMDALLSREDWATKLLTKLEERTLSLSQLGPTRKQQLRAHRNSAIRKRSERLFATATPKQRQQLIEQYVKAASSQPGDASRGKALFAKKCANCHRLDGVGHAIGPDLAALSNRTNLALITALLAPNASVEDKYLTYVVLRNDGRQLQGVLESESATAIRLIDAEAKVAEVLRGDVEALHSTGKSLMPEGMEKEVPVDQIADLMEYLRKSGPPPKSFAGNKPREVTPRDDGSLHLFATESRVYGPSVVLEDRYANLGFWASPQDRAVWSARTRKAGRYRVSIDYACANGVAGNRYVVEVAGQTVGGVVNGTGTWDQYGRMTAGVVELPAGPIELTFRSDGPIKQFLLDLRGVMLHPQ